jgi:hypothetical protein
MNCLFFTTVFNIFTTDLHFFTTPPSILTTHPSILTTLLSSLKSEICCYFGLGRHATHEIKISGDALTVSAPNICPSTTTVGTAYVRVICTGAASQSACRNVPSSHGRCLSLWASRGAVRSGQTQYLNYYNPLALHIGFEDADNGSVSDGKVDYGEEGAEHFANLKGAEHSADE